MRLTGLDRLRAANYKPALKAQRIRPACPAAFAPGCPATRTVASYSPTPKRSTAATGRSRRGGIWRLSYRIQTRSRRSTASYARRSRPRGTSRPRTPPQADLPRDPQRRPAMDPHPSLDQGATRVQDPIRRPAPRHCNLTATRQPSAQGLELPTGQPPTHSPGHPPRKRQ